MTKKEYEYIENTVRDIALFIRKCRVREEKERFKALFKVVESTAAPTRGINVASQLNKDRLAWTDKEIKEMPYLKDVKYRYIEQNKIHQYRYRRDGYNVQFSSKNKEVAKQKARNFVAELKENTLSEIEKRDKTINDVAKDWFLLKKPRLNVSAYKSYESAYRIHVAPIIGNLNLKSVLPMHLQPFFDDLFSRYGRTSEDVKIILNGVFEYAVANRFCATNPLKGVMFDKHERTTGKALTAEQRRRFYDVMIAKENRYGIIGLIILFTGIRGYEMQSLKFDWKNGTFTVKNAKLKRSQARNPDNLYRTVPIPPPLMQLRERIEQIDFNINPQTLANKFKLYWKENTVKDLRHTFITRARELGVENELVNLWTGHLPGKNVTANIYTHFSMEYQKKEMRKLKNYL